LGKHSCVTAGCGANDAEVWRLRRGAEIQEVRIESRVSVSDPTIKYQLAIDGVGIALLPHAVALADVESGLLVRLLPDWEPEPIEFYAVYSTRLNASPKVRAFLEFLRGRIDAEGTPFRLAQPSWSPAHAEKACKP
jgi:DNA-binding transcriptional LysR family regulator